MDLIWIVKAAELEFEKKWHLTPGEYFLGSGSHCAIQLSYPTVSRTHGKIEIKADHVFYSDLNSRNGSFLLTDNSSQECRLEGHSACLLGSQNQIKIGPYSMHWQAREDAQSTESSIDWNECLKKFQSFLETSPQTASESFFKFLGQTSFSKEQKEKIWERLHANFFGNGPLENYLNHPDCKEILVNSFKDVFIDLGQGLTRLEEGFLAQHTFDAWTVRTAQKAGRRLDLQNPICEATLDNGARFHAVLPPIASQNTAVAIRKFGSAPFTKEQALSTRWMTEDVLSFLQKAVHEKWNMVISGGTSSGKTSLLNFICQFLDPTERVITIEDTIELQPPVTNIVQMQARKPNADGVGEVSLRELIQCSLRMRPDRIIVGECRGPEVLEMLQALNTGHPGSLTTIHANSTKEAIHRLELLALLGAPNLSLEAIQKWISSSIELIVQVERGAHGHRHVREIAVHRSKLSSLEKMEMKSKPTFAEYVVIYEYSHQVA